MLCAKLAGLLEGRRFSSRPSWYTRHIVYRPCGCTIEDQGGHDLGIPQQAPDSSISNIVSLWASKNLHVS